MDSYDFAVSLQDLLSDYFLLKEEEIDSDKYWNIIDSVYGAVGYDDPCGDRPSMEDLVGEIEELKHRVESLEK